MRQCPDCEEKDRVVIAGKVFCANCGTPWDTKDPQEETAYLEKVGLVESKKEDVSKNVSSSPSQAQAAVSIAPAPMTSQTPVASAPPMPAPTMAPLASNQIPTQAPKPANVSAPVASNQAPVFTPPMPAIVTPAATSAPVQTQAPGSVAAPMSPVPSAPTQVPMSAQRPVMPQPAPKQSSPVSTPVSPVPMSSATSSAPINPVPMPAASSTVQSAPTPTPVAVPAPASEPKEQVASEIPSLDSKEEPVLSDSQLNAMSQVTAPPAQMTVSVAGQAPIVSQAAPSTGPKSLTDIVPRAIPAAQTIVVPTATPPTPQVPSASPAPVVVPAAQAPSSGAPANPAAPLTRDDALKLALSDTPAPAPSQGGVARPMALVASVMAFVLLGAYLWQSNYPSFALKLASVRSGVEAAAPGYLPSGWNVTRDVTSTNGTLIYKLQNKDRMMTVSQQRSDWDSQALLEQYILPKSQEYLALQAQGLTIYVFGNNQAAWVNHGVMYKLEGNHGLDQDQIIRMATSL